MAELHDRDPSSAAVLHSVPRWLAEMWWEELGPATARALLNSVNQPAESALRVNPLIGDVASVRDRLPVPSHPADELAEGLVLEAPFDAHGSDLWREGAIMPQSRGSMLVAHVAGPVPGDRVLDLCAAPGAKTTHLAALMKVAGEVVAVEAHRGRARALEANCRRLRAGSVRVEVADAAGWRSDRAFDRVLVDPPCSGLGTLQSRPDLRWRASPEAVVELARMQAAILAAGAAALRPRGTLTYSVCTISARESEQVINAFVEAHGEFEAEPLGERYPRWRHPRQKEFLQLLPHRDHTDGFFVARLRRRAL
jgi:16S rRNA (cytosine967-C5)-methyltransferase